MQYLYRCDCGWEAEVDYPMSGPVPETLDEYGEHPSPTEDGGTDRTLCYGILRRVYEPARTNMGYREGFHDSIEHYRFKHLAKD